MARQGLADVDLCSHMMITKTPAQSEEELDPESYPVNRLRNVAVEAVRTSHFLMTDIDIWPDKHAYNALHARYHVETLRFVSLSPSLGLLPKHPQRMWPSFMPLPSWSCPPPPP